MTFGFESEVDINFTFDYIEYFKAAVNASLDVENCPYECEVNLLLTDDACIREINKDNRGVDKATDVLSFPMNEYENPADFSLVEDDIALFNPESGELLLGDIVLSMDHIIAQAKEYEHSVEREYTFLIVHSMLHLMGYDHMEEDERILMEERQRIIMDKLSTELKSLEK